MSAAADPSGSAGPGALRLHCECGARFPVARDASGPREVACPACGARRELAPGRVDEHGGLWACQACGHPELYSKKDLPAWVGIAVVVVAAVLAPFTWYLSLAVAALVDFALYGLMPEVVVCYRCEAEHRRFAAEPRHPRFDREIAERLLFGQTAVMGKPMREGGTANAPEPEH